MKYLVILGSAIFSVSLHAASFDCNKARTYVEKTICDTPRLSKLDEDMAVVYRNKMAHAKTVGSWQVGHEKALQKEWLRYERNTCRTKTCIVNAYEARLGQAPTYQVKPTKPPKRAFGVFEMPMEISIYQGEQLGWEKTNVTQSLSIKRAKKTASTAVVNVDFVYTNGHTCILENEPVTWYENHFRLIKKDEDMSCELRFYPTSRGIYLKDIHHECRQRYCGARGGFDRFELTRKR